MTGAAPLPPLIERFTNNDGIAYDVHGDPADDVRVFRNDHGARKDTTLTRDKAGAVQNATGGGAALVNAWIAFRLAKGLAP